MIFKLLSTKSKLGIDIGTSAIKLIELSKKGGRFKLENYGVLEFKRTATNQDVTSNVLKLPDQEIIWGIKEIVKKAKIRTKDVVASIPSFSTFATVIEVPYLSEEDLAKAIPFEARKYVPIPLDEVILDWSIIEVISSKNDAPKTPEKSANPTTVEVFLAAVPKDETARYQNIIKEAGLNLIALELENSGLSRSLLGNDLSPTVLVNIGGRSTSIVIVDKGYERMGHNYEIGGYEITKAVMRALNINFEKAEGLKRKFGLSESGENMVKDAIVSLVDMMIFETKKTITNFEESKKQKISRVILVGGLVNMPNFVNHFKQRLGREVFVGNSFSRIIYPQQLSPLVQELSNNMSVTIGLAMR